VAAGKSIKNWQVLGPMLRFQKYFGQKIGERFGKKVGDFDSEQS
jgi:hypothetical protein